MENPWIFKKVCGLLRYDQSASLYTMALKSDTAEWVAEFRTTVSHIHLVGRYVSAEVAISSSGDLIPQLLLSTITPAAECTCLGVVTFVDISYKHQTIFTLVTHESSMVFHLFSDNPKFFEISSRLVPQTKLVIHYVSMCSTFIVVSISDEVEHNIGPVQVLGCRSGTACGIDNITELVCKDINARFFTTKPDKLAAGSYMIRCTELISDQYMVIETTNATHK